MQVARKLGEFIFRDCMRWPDGERWQLLDGHAYAVAPPSTAHQQVVFELAPVRPCPRSCSTSIACSR